jgi:hypothetical protein
LIMRGLLLYLIGVRSQLFGLNECVD